MKKVELVVLEEEMEKWELEGYEDEDEWRRMRTCCNCGVELVEKYNPSCSYANNYHVCGTCALTYGVWLD